ncbi:hypothetical protein [Stenotrophomonas bentonitica]|uniref:hypothetical protein n=1 Tax=Stenotrophomonas bentonitica TaxID=1450134 RepID=UPI00345EAE2F
MNQGRSGRDWAVVALMCFAAGALLVWALMSNHPGEAQADAKIDWPAWVQAAMSVVAILATAFVPRWIDARKKMDSADQFLVFAKYLLDSAESLHDSMSTKAGRMGLSMWGHKAEWRSIADGALELSLDLLPAPAYLPIWLELREMAVRMAEFYEGAIKYGDLDDYDPFADDMLDGYLYRTRNLYNKLVETDVKCRGFRGYEAVHSDE